MRHAVDLHEQVVALSRGQSPVGPAEQLEAALVRPEPAGGQLDRLSVDGDSVAVRGDLRDAEPVRLPAVAELVGARQRTRRLRSSAASERVEAGPIIGGILVGQLDRRLDQREVSRGAAAARLGSHPAGRASRCRPRPRVPSDRRAARAGSLGSSSRRQGSRPCRRAPGAGAPAPRPGRCPTQSACRSCESSSAGMWSPSVTAGVDPETGTGRQSQVNQPAWRRYEPERRVLRAQSDLDRVPDRRRRGRPRVAHPRRRAAASLTRSSPVTASVTACPIRARASTCHERDAARRRLVLELDRAGAAVARHAAPAAAPHP